MSNPFEFAVSLRVTHPDIDPAVITDVLGVTPDRCWKVGDPRVTPKGAALEGVYRESHWIAALGNGSDGEIAHCLEQALDRLSRHGTFLTDLRKGGGDLQLFVFWGGNGNTGAVLDAALLGRMAELGIDLRLDVYDSE